MACPIVDSWLGSRPNGRPPATLLERCSLDAAGRLEANRVDPSGHGQADLLGVVREDRWQLSDRVR